MDDTQLSETSDVTDAFGHWSGVWADKAPADTSWFQESPEPCSRLIRSVSTTEDRVAMIGVGASPLVADLLAHGYQHLEAIDISEAALQRLREQLGAQADRVRLRQADVRTIELDDPVDVWHDRATFHFLTTPTDRVSYARCAASAVRAGGHLVVSTFALDGPEQCSGLPVARYDAPSLAAQFADAFKLVDTLGHEHQTPWGSRQSFLYAVLRRTSHQREL